MNSSDLLYFTNTTTLDISIYLVLKLKYLIPSLIRRVVLYEYNISRHFYISGTEIEIYLYLNFSDVVYFTNTTSLDFSIYLVLKLKYTYT